MCVCVRRERYPVVAVIVFMQFGTTRGSRWSFQTALQRMSPWHTEKEM